MAISDWFPVGRSDRKNNPGWRLDIVSLLAVIGETSIAEHAQPLTSSWLCLLPRLIPAPQALLKSTRPTRLPATSAVVVGVHSGTRVDSLNYFADLLHNISELREYDFQEYDLDWSEHKKEKEDTAPDTEAGVNGESAGPKIPVVDSATFSPLRIITFGSFIMTWGLFIWAACIHDAVACFSIFALSASASLGCAGQWWRPKLAKRVSTAPVPRADVVIRSREGAFVVVHCERDEVARELYIGTEACDYIIKNGDIFKAASGIGIFLLMIGVVLLGNCNWTMQAAIGVAFVLLNGAYWLASLADGEKLWDMSRFDLKRVTDKPYHKDVNNGVEPNYTRTLWFAIQATGQIEWVSRSNAAPQTEAWTEWLKEAHKHRKDADWDAVGEKDRLMKAAKEKADPDNAYEGPQSQIAPPEAGIPPPTRRLTDKE